MFFDLKMSRFSVAANRKVVLFEKRICKTLIVQIERAWNGFSPFLSSSWLASFSLSLFLWKCVSLCSQHNHVHIYVKSHEKKVSFNWGENDLCVEIQTETADIGVFSLWLHLKISTSKLEFRDSLWEAKSIELPKTWFLSCVPREAFILLWEINE